MNPPHYNPPATRHPQGSALLLVLILMSALTVGLMIMTGKFLSGKPGRNSTTSTRMRIIAEALRRHYLGHQDLPAEKPNRGIPIRELLLDGKYKFDGWGNPLQYRCYRINKNGRQRLKLNGITYDGGTGAAILVSAGPDQILQSTFSEDSVHQILVCTQKQDDILRLVNLQAEAIAIADRTLRSLADKLTCPFVRSPNWDPTDVIGCLIDHYALNPGLYRTDPWGNDYRWQGGNNCGFFSSGPDGTDNTTDDIRISPQKCPVNCDELVTNRNF